LRESRGVNGFSASQHTSGAGTTLFSGPEGVAPLLGPHRPADAPSNFDQDRAFRASDRAVSRCSATPLPR